jgi:nicotinate-nucleotide pyrophosphorylase (carboxylating)
VSPSSTFEIDIRVEWHLDEGTEFDPIAKLATVAGPARNILLGERIALNTLARCSGIATKYKLGRIMLNEDLAGC